MIKRLKSLKHKMVLKMTMAMAVMAMAIPTIAGAAPDTGNADIDTVLTSLDSGFTTVKDGFVYLALAAIPITLIVVAFFWLRGKFKQAVSGA